MPIDWFNWMQSGHLKSAADFTANGGVLTEEDARQALEELRLESVEHARKLVGEKFYEQYFPTDRHGGQWKSGAPVGLVDHYTAGISARGTLRWFSSKPRGPGVGNSSAHVVLSREGAVIVIIDPLEHVAWHATWANKNHIGIEHVNAGLLSKTPAGKVVYMGKHTYPEDRLGDIQEFGGTIWEPYTSYQIANNLVFKRWLIWACPTLVRERFVDHEIIDPARKRDCGPLWPLKDLNDLAFSDVAFRDFKSLQGTIMRKNALAVFHNEAIDALK